MKPALESDKKLGHRVYVEWQDSAAKFGWTGDNVPNVASIATCAILIGVNKSGICITTSVDKDQGGIGFHGTLSIPWITITKFDIFEQIVKLGED